MLQALSALTRKTRTAVQQATGRSRAAPPAAVQPGGLSSALLGRLGRPLCDETRELSECQALLDWGRDLARQDRWERLGTLIAQADGTRKTTFAGTPEAELLAAGARSDLSRALDTASSAGALSRGHRMFAGLQAMDDLVSEFAGDAGIAAVVALSHMDAGWAWYKQGWQRGRPEQHLDRFRAAFARAEEILAPFADQAAGSPLIASTRCALLAGQPGAEAHVVGAYETLIAQAPTVPGHMRAFGLHLLPCWFGSYAALDLAARRMAAATGATWGCGAYAWVWFDALLQDRDAFAALDAEFLIEAIDDILTRHPDQHMVNLLAAFLSQILARETGPDRSQRRLLEKMRNRLIRAEMTETHGWVWSLTDIGYATPGSSHGGARTDAETGAHHAWAALSTVLSRDLRRISTRPSPAP
ncbi:hypothetical protein [Marinovum sp.]|uniref:hypothetical protein n=1 Tax=Marinovum sp. TaxID=2024839 RepID=UPI002B27A465|nr:hypothetical protein [Marinovum sp.]